MCHRLFAHDQADGADHLPTAARFTHELLPSRGVETINFALRLFSLAP
jgi:hypothetical protein